MKNKGHRLQLLLSYQQNNEENDEKADGVTKFPTYSIYFMLPAMFTLQRGQVEIPTFIVTRLLRTSIVQT